MASMSKNKKSKTDGDAGENKEAENTEKLASKSAQQERMFRNMSDKLQYVSVCRACCERVCNMWCAVCVVCGLILRVPGCVAHGHVLRPIH
eukprot:m.135369 g.135369  ORF g.135369 m.135369 type:complete len:91 (-) comp9525_c0_seq12:506-778(-)